MMKIAVSGMKSLALCVLTIAVPLLAPSCVDDRYNLDNISPEITIGGEEVLLPLGEIKTKTLEEMLGEDFGRLTTENGVYVLKMEDEGEPIVVEGLSLPLLTNIAPKIDDVTFSAPSLPTDFMFSRIETSFEMDYPDLDVAPMFEAIEFASDINLGISLPEGQTIPAMGKLSLGDSGKVPFEASFDIPEQIRNVGKLYFGEDSNDYGSLIEMELEFNGLKSINGGGKLNFKLNFPENYTLVDASGRVLGNTFEVKNYTVAEKVESVSLKAYLQSIDFSKKGVARGTMNIADEISYEFDYEFQSIAGYCNSSSLPKFNITVEPKFRDMEIEINSIVIDDTDHNADVVYTLNGIPESIQSIDYVAFNSAPITMKVDGLSWLQIDALQVEMQLPEGFIFSPDAGGWLDTSTNKLVAPVRQLERGITLQLKAIDCAKCNAEIKSGQLSIKTSIQSHISDLNEGMKFMLSEILPPSKKLEVYTIIDESHFNINLVDSKVKMREQYFDFKLDDGQLPRVEHTIDVPDELVAIERLVLSSPKGEPVKVRLGISHPENEVFPVDKVYLSLSVNFKQLIHPVAGQKFIEKAPNGDNILRLDHIEWRPNDNARFDVIEVEIDAIENLPAIVGEKGSKKIVIDEKFAVTGGVSIDAGTNINLEAASAKLNFDFSIDDAQVSKFYGTIDYRFKPEELPQIELGVFMGDGLTVENLDVAPIIRFNINNPIDIPFNASLSLKPFDSDGNYMAANSVTIDNVHIDGAKRTQLVLSTEARREQFENRPDITFVEFDLPRLFKGKIPSKIAVEMEVASDTSVTHEIDLTKSRYELGYDYAVEIPLEFGHNFDISYEVNIDELKSVFESIDELPLVSVGEVAIIADFTTTIPLDFILETECLDENGNPTKAQVTLDSDNMIHGHHPEDAEPEAKSTLVLKLDLGEDGDITNLKEIDVLRMRLNMRNNSHTPSALSPDQIISGKLRLRVRDGITIDLGKIAEGVTEDVAE